MSLFDTLRDNLGDPEMLWIYQGIGIRRPRDPSASPGSIICHTDGRIVSVHTSNHLVHPGMPLHLDVTVVAHFQLPDNPVVLFRIYGEPDKIYGMFTHHPVRVQPGRHYRLTTRHHQQTVNKPQWRGVMYWFTPVFKRLATP